MRPSLGFAELRAALWPGADAADCFERELAAHFGVRHALVFPYGRSAIFTCLRALNLTGGDVVQPAYNCLAVAHATVVAGCRPVFVDAQPDSPNQNPEQMAARIGPETVAVLPTSVFGLTFDLTELCRAIRARNPNTLVLTDCCLCFDGSWRGEPLATHGDAAVLAFGVEKPITTLFGGALLTSRDDIVSAVRRYRNETFRSRTWLGTVGRLAYFVGFWTGYSSRGAAIADWLSSHGPLARRQRAARSLRDNIRLPVDADVLMSPIEAAIGRVQLRRVAAMTRRRREIAAVYRRELGTVSGLRFFEADEGSSQAICAAYLDRPEQRRHLLDALREQGVLAGTVWDYVIPGLGGYRDRGYRASDFPCAQRWSASVINLPNHPTMTDDEVGRVIRATRIWSSSTTGSRSPSA